MWRQIEDCGSDGGSEERRKLYQTNPHSLTGSGSSKELAANAIRDGIRLLIKSPTWQQSLRSGPAQQITEPLKRERRLPVCETDGASLAHISGASGAVFVYALTAEVALTIAAPGPLAEE